MERIQLCVFSFGNVDLSQSQKCLFVVLMDPLHGCVDATLDP